MSAQAGIGSSTRPANRRSAFSKTAAESISPPRNATVGKPTRGAATSSLSVFWNTTPPTDSRWLDALRKATELDGVRVLEHRLTEKDASQFLISTRPDMAPPEAARSVKGRLQYLVRDKLPKALRRNYSLWSVGTVNAKVIEGYHPMADPHMQRQFDSLSIDGDSDALANPRLSGHAQFCYNLHLVFVSRDRDIEVRAHVLEARRAMLLAAAAKKGHLIGKGQIVADHLHVALGCQLSESPQEVALSYMNNLAYAAEMKPVFQYGFYVGTFGRYDLDAIRQKLR
jgi:REP element-mobilizing transposase RayT